MSQGVYRIQGREVRLPVCVRQAHSIASMYWVPTAAVRRLVDHPNLQIPEIVPGRTLCVIGLIDYIDNDLGDYNEISIGFFASIGRKRPARFGSLPLGLMRGGADAYIHRLPVNQAFTCEAGQTIWGFPKTVDEIEFRDGANTRTCSWHKDGRHVLTCEARTGGKGEYRDREMVSLAVRDGVLYRTPFTSHGREVGARLGGAHLTLGDHPIADELRSLGLPRRPLFTTSIGHMSAAFGAPEKL
jgi:hypothetical protein